MRPGFAALCLLMIGLGGAACTARPVAFPSPPRVAQPNTRAPKGPTELARARDALRRSRYDRAEAQFRAAENGADRSQARLGLAEVLFLTGRSAEAAELARRVAQENPKLGPPAAIIGAEALRDLGRLGDAETRLRAVTGDPEARRARLLLAEVLLESGRRDQAEPLLNSLVDDYNQDRIRESDGLGLALVGRAAHLLQSPKDANDAYNQAERAGAADAQTLLWRAELYLEAHDAGHAEEVLADLLKTAPDHAEALARLAEVKIGQTFDFQAATDLGRRALRIRPGLARAHFVLAGVALRDMELAQADRELDAGLSHNPRALDLLSLKAAVRFLADDAQGFARGMQVVQGHNPHYSRMYAIIGEYADWEHRYEAIVELMKTAVARDPEDGAALAELGLNLIRAGDDRSGVLQLGRAFRRDPFNVRVYNTLNLFEKVIPREYATVERGHFRIRYQRSEQPLLDRYLPAWLAQGYQVFSGHYRFAPSAVVGAEIYPSKEHFSIRTAGLPNVGIQGVSFGRTFAALSPEQEPFNLGMTVWHELAHVFHIQLSKYHVPRWFTEGLAEYETMLARPEWKREHDLELFAALEAGRIPPIEQMNRVFTHARDMNDMTVAYYASSQILVMLGERFGMPALARMIELWGEGKRTPEVFQATLGLNPAELDHAFHEWEKKRLARYQGQFMPVRPPATLDEARAAALRNPNDARIQAAYGIALLQADDSKEAARIARKAVVLDPRHPDVRWLSAQLARIEGDFARSERMLEALAAGGHDGYAVELALGTLWLERRDPTRARRALEAAHRFDPTQAEPLVALAQLLRRSTDGDGELAALKALAEIDQHEPGIYRRLMRVLLDKKLGKDALKIGEAALYVDVLGAGTHLLMAEALERDGQMVRAEFELGSATLCPGDPASRAAAHLKLAQLLDRRGQRKKAEAERAKARALVPAGDGSQREE